MRPISQMTWFKENVREEDIYEREIGLSGMNVLILMNELRIQ